MSDIETEVIELAPEMREPAPKKREAVVAWADTDDEDDAASTASSNSEASLTFSEDGKIGPHPASVRSVSVVVIENPAELVLAYTGCIVLCLVVGATIGMHLAK